MQQNAKDIIRRIRAIAYRELLLLRQEFLQFPKAFLVVLIIAAIVALLTNELHF